MRALWRCDEFRLAAAICSPSRLRSVAGREGAAARATAPAVDMESAAVAAAPRAPRAIRRLARGRRRAR
jgi:hypothetical protein